uniref:Aldehyde dehydrogenase domain-containing protein n=1 Tax=Glossina palpalis gambiensis TaxID=67801 RepID=A0A1B0C3Q2_9MUSC
MDVQGPTSSRAILEPSQSNETEENDGNEDENLAKIHELRSAPLPIMHSGHIVSVIKFKTEEEEALEKAKQTQRGLAGYFSSENLQQVFRVAKLFELRMVNANGF